MTSTRVNPRTFHEACCTPHKFLPVLSGSNTRQVRRTSTCICCTATAIANSRSSVSSLQKSPANYVHSYLDVHHQPYPYIKAVCVRSVHGIGGPCRVKFVRIMVHSDKCRFPHALCNTGCTIDIRSTSTTFWCHKNRKRRRRCCHDKQQTSDTITQHHSMEI